MAEDAVAVAAEPGAAAAGMPEVEREHLVILVHGIRDFGFWRTDLTRSLEKAGFSVEPTNYDWFDPLRFLWPLKNFREAVKRKVWKQIQRATELHPGADVSFIAHSFGTYVVAHILNEQTIFKPKRLVLCGSVLPYDFDFELLRNAIAGRRQNAHRGDKAAPNENLIVNEVGSKDVWPAFAESITTGYGSAGSYGFNTPGVKDRFHPKAGHGYYLTADFCDQYWVPFLNDGTVVPAGAGVQPPLWVRMLKFPLRLGWILTVLLALLMIWAGLASFYGPRPVTIEIDQQAPMVQRAAEVAAVRPPVPAAQIVAPADVQFLYWAGAIQQFDAALNQTLCWLPLGLCSVPWLPEFITGRSFGPFTVGNSMLADVVSCDNFRGSDNDPRKLLQSFVATFPQCVRLDMGPTGMLTLLPIAKGLRPMARQGEGPAQLCGCDGPFVEEFIKRQEESP